MHCDVHLLRGEWRLLDYCLDNDEDCRAHNDSSHQCSHGEHNSVDKVGVALKVAANASTVALHGSLHWGREIGLANGAIADDLCVEQECAKMVFKCVEGEGSVTNASIAARLICLP